MHNKTVAFLEILKVELQDLDEDIKILIEEYKEKHSRDEISNYVFLENLAVLKNELFGVEGFYKHVENINPSDYKTLADLINNLMEVLKVRIHEKGLAHSLINMVERKINKILKYVIN